MNWHDGLIVAKDPDSVLDWAWDYSDWLETSDTLDSHTVTAESGITVDSSSISGDQVVVWLSGGTAGTTYDVTVRAVTTDGRTVDRTVSFEVSAR